MAKNRPKSVNALSVSRAVREEVESDFSVRDSLARNYANLSALAKMLLPKVEARTGRKAGEQGVLSALKRVRETTSTRGDGVGKVVAASIVNVRTSVSRLSVEKTRKTLQAVSSLLSVYQEDFIQVSESLASITLIFDQRLHGKVKKALAGTEVLEEGEDCAALTVHSPEQIISTPGCVSSFYDQLARKKVNVEDTVSCYTDTILVVSMKDASRAFEALTELVSDEQRKLGRDGQG